MEQWETPRPRPILPPVLTPWGDYVTITTTGLSWWFVSHWLGWDDGQDQARPELP